MKIRVEVNEITYVLVGDKAKPQKLEQSIIEMCVDWFSVQGIRILGSAGNEKHHDKPTNLSTEKHTETYERNQHANMHVNMWYFLYSPSQMIASHVQPNVNQNTPQPPYQL